MKSRVKDCHLCNHRFSLGLLFLAENYLFPCFLCTVCEHLIITLQSWCWETQIPFPLQMNWNFCALCQECKVLLLIPYRSGLHKIRALLFVVIMY